MPPVGYLACANVNDALPLLPAGSAQLAVMSPRYLSALVDYAAAARGEDKRAWNAGPQESLGDYLAEHRTTVELLAAAMTPDATVCVEIDEVRDGAKGARQLLHLSDCWRALLVGAGFRIVEHLRLGRALALGHRSGHFIRTAGQPGTFLPDNVCSTLIVAQRGDPMARLRHESRHRPEWHTPVDWARPFLTNLWRLGPTPRTRHRDVRVNQNRILHPVPMDLRVAEACVRFYSLPGDTILAPFAGSGTVAAAAVPLGRTPICIEREPGFAALIRERVDVDWRPLTAVDRPTMRPSVRLALPIGAAAEAMARHNYLARPNTGDVTARHRAIAMYATKNAGIVLTPEIIAAVMSAERSYCSAHHGSRATA